MTTCDYCRTYLACHTEEQWQNRQANMKYYPEVQLSQCSRCGGVGWAVTREMIEPEPPRVGWFKRLFGGKP